MSHPSFTCITCRVAFDDADLQRSHYKTDWHRYNLKRKVAELPSVTAENFQQRVLAQKAQVSEMGLDTSGHCQLCNKHFSTLNAHETHLKSKKHKVAETKQEQKLQAEVERQNQKNLEKGLEPVVNKNALKDAQNKLVKSTFSSYDRGIKKQQPSTSQSSGSTADKGADEEMDSDAESAESWEGEALGLEECLFCSKISPTLEDNVKHMTDGHSFFLPDAEYLADLEGLIVYLGEKIGVGCVCLWCNEKGKSFYTTKSVQQHMLDKGHCKMLHEGDALLEYAEFYDYRSSYPDCEGDASTDVEMKDDEEEEEDEVDLQDLKEENYQLVLPSGNSIGHRSLIKYYRQNLPQRRKVNKSSVDRILSHYRALGWIGTTGEVAKKKFHDLRFIQRFQQKRNIQVAMKQNKLPKHVRNQVFYGMKT